MTNARVLPWNPDGTECANSATTRLSRADQALPVRSPATTELNPSPSPLNTSVPKLNTFGQKLNTLTAKVDTSGPKLDTLAAKLDTFTAKVDTSAAKLNTCPPRPRPRHPGEFPRIPRSSAMSRSSLAARKQIVYTQSIASRLPGVSMPTLGVHRQSGSVHLTLRAAPAPSRPRPRTSSPAPHAAPDLQDSPDHPRKPARTVSRWPAPFGGGPARDSSPYHPHA